MTTPLIKRVWRRLRITQPFNALSTSLFRGLMTVGMKGDCLVEHLPYIGVVKLSLPNGATLKLRSHGDDYIVNQIFWKKVYEPETAPVFFRLAQKARITLDIGAHVGFYALLAGHANRAGQVYAFEPLPKTYERLIENIALNRLLNVRGIASAMGTRTGSAEIFFDTAPDIPSNTTLKMPERLAPNRAMTSTRVPVTTVKTFIQENVIEHVDLIKMDTEGTELDVIQGMEDLLARDRPAIFCEVLEGIGESSALEEILRPLGYKFYRLEPNGPALQSRIEPHALWWNHLFTTSNLA
jgi:FkbM family methyltransferase